MWTQQQQQQQCGWKEREAEDREEMHAMKERSELWCMHVNMQYLHTRYLLETKKKEKVPD